MIRFLIDEDMPRLTARALTERGFDCVDARDIGLRGVDDDVLYEWAQKENRIILTGDLGFSNTLRFPLGSHKGIVIARFPNEMSTERLNQILMDAITDICEDLPGNLAIIEPDKIRIRRRSLDIF
jgi:predicted nuclease of predicted toxin-antitoxin system